MSEKIIITFPDGNKKEVDKGINGLELASQISKSLAKESVAIKINNEIKDINLPINGCLLYTSPSPRDRLKSRMPSSA